MQLLDSKLNEREIRVSVGIPTEQIEPAYLSNSGPLYLYIFISFVRSLESPFFLLWNARRERARARADVAQGISWRAARALRCPPKRKKEKGLFPGLGKKYLFTDPLF